MISDAQQFVPFSFNIHLCIRRTVAKNLSRRHTAVCLVSVFKPVPDVHRYGVSTKVVLRMCSYHIDMPTNLDRGDQNIHHLYGGQRTNNLQNIVVINVSMYYSYSIHGM